jgi:hypothetical protein
MPDKYGHRTDEELLLAADGELNARDAEEARLHLQSCWECRTRTAEMEASIAEFVHLHHTELDAHIPAPEGPRSLLKARMAEAARAASQPDSTSSWQAWAAKFTVPRLAYLSAGVLVLGLSAQLLWHRTPSSKLNREMRAFFDRPEPDRRLTPGSFRAVPLQQVCTAANYEQARVTSISLKQKVFQEYGMTGATTSNYEVDFLVTPELGGTDDIQNLWPEPYSSTVWNAHVKDELEDRLHELVCEQKVDLQTAQHDIATDWIAAYKKYFHTDKPLSVGSNI